MTSPMAGITQQLSTALQQQLGGLSMPSGVAQQLMATMNGLETLPSDPEWYNDARAVIRAAINERKLSTNDWETVDKVISHMTALVALDEELDDFAAERYRTSASKLTQPGRKLNFYDEKMLDELCSLLAVAQGVKTQYEVTAVDDPDNPDILKVSVAIKPIYPMQTIEIKFTLSPVEEGAEVDSDDMILARTVVKRAMTELRHGLERRIMLRVDKREQEQRMQAQAQQRRQIDEVQAQGAAYRAGLFGSGAGGLRAAFGPMITMNTA